MNPLIHQRRDITNYIRNNEAHKIATLLGKGRDRSRTRSPAENATSFYLSNLQKYAITPTLRVTAVLNT